VKVAKIRRVGPDGSASKFAFGSQRQQASEQAVTKALVLRAVQMSNRRRADLLKKDRV
jgi:hypothetical protein